MSSNFENLPLPVNRDAQDYSRLVPANSTVEIPVVGEFVYCKFSDGEIRVVINGKSTNMESGDERRSGEGTVFRGVNLINDTGVAKYVIFVIGFGGFDRKIIQGEITTVPGVRRADGTFVKDSRYDIDMFIMPASRDVAGEVAASDILNVGVITEAFTSSSTLHERGGVLTWFGEEPGTNKKAIYSYDEDLNLIGVERAFGENAPNTYADVVDAVPEFGTNNFLAWYDEDGDLKRWNTTLEQWETVINGSPNIIGFGLYKTGYISLQGSGGEPYKGYVNFYDETGDFVSRVDLQDQLQNSRYRYPASSRFQIFYDRFNDRIVISVDRKSGNEPPEVLILNGDATQVIQERSAFYIQVANNAGYSSSLSKMIVIGDICYMTSPYDDGLIKAQFNTFEYNFTGLAFNNGCENELINVDSLAIRTGANISTQVIDGVTVVNGQVIRAALELYFNSNVDDDYMDNVFSVEIFNTGGRRVGYSAGGRGDSLLALGIVDDLRAAFPGRIRLGVDSDLTLFDKV